MASRWISRAVGAVLEVVADARGFGGQLLGLAHGDEAGVQAVGERGAEDEAAGLDAEDEVDVLADVVRGQRVDELREAGLVLQQRGDVVEEDAGLGEVGHGADEFLERLAINRNRHDLYHAPSISNGPSCAPSLSASSSSMTASTRLPREPLRKCNFQLLRAFGRACGDDFDVALRRCSSPSRAGQAPLLRDARTSGSRRPAPGL